MSPTVPGLRNGVGGNGTQVKLVRLIANLRELPNKLRDNIVKQQLDVSYPARTKILLMLYTLVRYQIMERRNTITIPEERQADLEALFDEMLMCFNDIEDPQSYARQLLQGPFVRPFFQEYQRDYLDGREHLEEITQPGELARLCDEWDVFEHPAYKEDAAPDKSSWSVKQHTARFIIRVLHFSWRNGGRWKRGSWKYDRTYDIHGESDIEFFEVWGVLRYLQVEWEAANLVHWDVGHLRAWDTAS